MFWTAPYIGLGTRSGLTECAIHYRHTHQVPYLGFSTWVALNALLITSTAVYM